MARRYATKAINTPALAEKHRTTDAYKHGDARKSVAAMMPGIGDKRHGVHLLASHTGVVKQPLFRNHRDKCHYKRNHLRTRQHLAVERVDNLAERCPEQSYRNGKKCETYKHRSKGFKLAVSITEAGVLAFCRDSYKHNYYDVGNEIRY